MYLTLTLGGSKLQASLARHAGSDGFHCPHRSLVSGHSGNSNLLQGFIDTLAFFLAASEGGDHYIANMEQISKWTILFFTLPPVGLISLFRPKF